MSDGKYYDIFGQFCTTFDHAEQVCREIREKQGSHFEPVPYREKYKQNPHTEKDCAYAIVDRNNGHPYCMKVGVAENEEDARKATRSYIEEYLTEDHYKGREFVLHFLDAWGHRSSTFKM